MKTIMGKLLFMLVVVFAVGCDNDDTDLVEPTHPEKPTQMTLSAKGSALGQLKKIIHPETGMSFEASCYQLDLMDPTIGDIVGMLQYCIFKNVIPSDGTITSSVIATLFLNDKGSIVAENEVLQTLQAPYQELNFLVQAEPTEDNVINGTSDFEDMKGTLSLSGKVNLADLGEGVYHFDYLFTIDLSR